MGTGWRRAFCTSIPRDRETSTFEKQQRSLSPSPSPRNCTKLAFLSSGSNPSTPRLQSQPISNPTLRCRTINTSATPMADDTPRLQQCKSTPKLVHRSNSSSPRSPSRFSLFKNSLRLSRSSCGICLQSVKAGQRTAIFTAECSHAFHFPCISAHVRKHNILVCPVCNASWREVPLLPQPPPLNPKQDKDESAEIEEKENNKIIKSGMKNRESSLSDVKIKQDLQRKPSDRVYDDDEPLFSPATGGRFNPIPEADETGAEEEEEDESKEGIEEFQGFFINNPSTQSSSNKSAKSDAEITPRTLRNVEVKLSPEIAVVSIGRSHETYAVLLKVKAPPPARNSTKADTARRAPIDLITVLDVSGSMNGAKLQMLKRAMRLVISSLGSADRLSIVAFSATPKRLLPLTKMTSHGQRSARCIIDRLVCGQGTSVGDALRKATKVLEDRRERNPVASIMLLSDGQNERVSTKSTNRRSRSLNVSSTRFAHLEIPVHASGFGENGSSRSHEPAEDAFAKCVGGLLSVVVQDFRLQLNGSSQAEISAVYSCNGRPTVLGSSSTRLGDLYAEEERELLVEFKVPTAAVGAHHVISVKCCFKDPATQEVIYGKEQSLPVAPPHIFRSSAPKVERLRNFFITTRAVAEARRLIEKKELSSACHLLSSARALLMQSNSLLVDEYIRGLEVELAELNWLRQQQQHHQQQQQQQIQRRNREPSFVDENGEPLTPTSAWRAAEQLAKVAMMRKSLNRVSDLHGFENARF